VNRRASGETDHGELPRSPFELIDELSCYYDTPAEPNNVLSEVLVPGVIDYPTLRRAVAGALALTPRARARMAPGGAFRRRYTWEFPSVPSIDPLAHTTWSDEQELLAARVRFMASSPSLRTSPPVRLLLATGPDASCVMLNAHHAAMDGISCAELLRDIAECYRALTENSARSGTSAGWTPEGPLPPLPLVPPLPPLPAGSPMRGWVCPVRRHFVARIAPERGRGSRRAGGDGCGLLLLLVPSVPSQSGATVNDALVAALIATISRWNAAHHRPPATIRITVPVNVREPGLRGVAGNHTRTATVVADPRTASRDLPVLIAAVAAQTSVIRQAGLQGASAGPLGLAPGWCPVVLKRLAVRIALRGLGSLLCDTSMLSNLGNVRDAPWSEPGRPVRMAMSSPVHMPRGLSVGAMTADGRLQLCFRYRYALFDDVAAARFVATYAAVLDELAAGTVPAELKGSGSRRGGTSDPAASAAQDSRMPGRQGLADVLRRRGPAVQPAPEARLPDRARRAGDAGRAGRASR
jgi:NRPS condensation-like uncharacterized protein